MSKNVKQLLTEAQNTLFEATLERDNEEMYCHILDTLQLTLQVLSHVVDTLPEVQAVDAASDAQTRKDSA